MVVCIEWPLGVKKDNGLEQDKCYHMNAQGDNYTCILLSSESKRKLDGKNQGRGMLFYNHSKVSIDSYLIEMNIYATS